MMVRSIICVLLAITLSIRADDGIEWTKRERVLIRSLSLASLGEAPKDPSNKFADNSLAADLGGKLFHDKRLSKNGKVSCAQCHQADYGFTDKLPQSIGIGKMDRRSMPALGMAYQQWFFWDGRADSLWSQTLQPLENSLEHGLTREQCVELVIQHYAKEYTALFGELPTFEKRKLNEPDSWSEREQVTQVFVNLGKSIAAFVRTLKPQETAFDRYARALDSQAAEGIQFLDSKQQRGLRLFLGKARCVDCHNGPMLSNGSFHHVGVPDLAGVDRGRAAVLVDLADLEFGYFSKWSDADPEKDGEHVKFMDQRVARYERAFKTPSLRGVAERPPYMHAGQFESLKDVLLHYRKVSQDQSADEVLHADLTDAEIDDLVEFLKSLNSQ